MKRLAVVLVAVLIVLGLVGVVSDRVVASIAEGRITSAVAADLPGATGVSTQVSDVPVLTQLASGRLRHVTVSMVTLPSQGVTLDDVIVDLHDVTTSSPYTARHVRATASIPSEQLAEQLGSDWTVRTDGDAIVATWRGVITVDARLVPAVSDGRLTLTLASVSALGVSIDGSQVPAVVHERIDALAGSLTTLPLGLTLDSVRVTSTGVDVLAEGGDVVLG